MNDTRLIADLLKENFPQEYAVIGPTNFEEIVEGEVKFKAAQYGSFMDLDNAIEILVIAVSFIKIVLEIYKILVKDLGRKPYRNELDQRIIESKQIDEGNLEFNTRDSLIKGIMHKLIQE